MNRKGTKPYHPHPGILWHLGVEACPPLASRVSTSFSEKGLERDRRVLGGRIWRKRASQREDFPAWLSCSKQD